VTKFERHWVVAVTRREAASGKVRAGREDDVAETEEVEGVW
jgi:hypothetical protein